MDICDKIDTSAYIINKYWYYAPGQVDICEKTGLKDIFDIFIALLPIRNKAKHETGNYQCVE